MGRRVAEVKSLSSLVNAIITCIRYILLYLSRRKNFLIDLLDTEQATDMPLDSNAHGSKRYGDLGMYADCRLLTDCSTCTRSQAFVP